MVHLRCANPVTFVFAAPQPRQEIRTTDGWTHSGKYLYGLPYRGKRIEDDNRKWCPMGGIISHGGKPFFTVGNHFPRWEIIFHGGLQTFIHRGGGRPPLLCGYSLWMRVWWLGEQEIPPWKMISDRGKCFPTVENDFPPWQMVSHRGISFPTVGYHSPRWDINSYSFNPLF